MPAARLAQSAERKALNLVVVGSSPTVGALGGPAARCHLLLRAAKVVPRGLEPRTLRLLAVRSNQLSYETVGVVPHRHQMAAATTRTSHVAIMRQERIELPTLGL